MKVEVKLTEENLDEIIKELKEKGTPEEIITNPVFKRILLDTARQREKISIRYDENYKKLIIYNGHKELWSLNYDNKEKGIKAVIGNWTMWELVDENGITVRKKYLEGRTFPDIEELIPMYGNAVKELFVELIRDKNNPTKCKLEVSSPRCKYGSNNYYVKTDKGLDRLEPDLKRECISAKPLSKKELEEVISEAALPTQEYLRKQCNLVSINDVVENAIQHDATTLEEVDKAKREIMPTVNRKNPGCQEDIKK